MSDTPMRAGVDAYLARQAARFHMPGHKGALPHPFAQVAPYDITEVAGVDSLYEAEGIIRQTEDVYRALYGSAGSFLSAGGSTLCIQAMLALAKLPGNAPAKILCGRGVHTAAVNAMALLDWTPVWLYPDARDAHGLTGAIAPQAVAQALAQDADIAAVYLTSPNYYGVLCDIAAIAAICRQYGVPLLVDNAHGAHLKFLPQSLHPMDLGADVCTDSLHKTLPVLTGGALLHIGRAEYCADAKRKMALFGSTSPSYLIMLSADMALEYLHDRAAADTRRVAGIIAELAELAAVQGFTLPGAGWQTDPLRLTLGFRPLGFAAQDFGDYIRARGIEPEYLGESYCVLLASPTTADADLARVRAAITQAAANSPKRADDATVTATAWEKPIAAMSLREAMFAPTERVAVAESAGRVASGLCAPCPPGIPLVVPGEKISDNMVRALKNYGIFCINVVK